MIITQEITEEIISVISGNANMLNNASVIAVYPNPVADKLFTDLNGKEIIIQDLNGREVVRSSSKKIDISQLISGQYLVKGYDENEQLLFRQKIVKE